MTAEQIQQAAMTRSVARKLSITVSKDGETSTVYFSNRERYENFVSRALHLGWAIENNGEPSAKKG